MTGPDAATVEVETIAPNRAREASQLSGASEAALEWVRQPGYAAESSFARSWSGREQPEADESFLGADDTGDSPWQGHSTAKSADVQAQSTGFSADVETASRSGMARHSTFSLPRPWAEEVHAIRVATCWKRWDVCEPPCQVPRERTLPHHLRLMDPAACVQPDDCLTLGQFLQTCCFNLRRQCTNPKCREGVKLHEQCFSHHGSRLSIRVLQLPAEHARPAEEGLFAWSVCRACPQPARAGPRVPLSAQTCTLSFGRFLESNFQQLDRVLALLRLLASAASTPRAVYQLRCSGVCPSRPALRRLRHDTASSAAATRRRGRRAGRHPTNFLDEREPARRQTSRPLTVEYRRARARELARVGGRPTRVRRSRTLESYARAAAGGHAIGRRHQQTRDPI